MGNVTPALRWQTITMITAFTELIFTSSQSVTFRLIYILSRGDQTLAGMKSYDLHHIFIHIMQVLIIHQQKFEYI